VVAGEDAAGDLRVDVRRAGAERGRLGPRDAEVLRGHLVGADVLAVDLDDARC
jgi:hypothetical protein